MLMQQCNYEILLHIQLLNFIYHKQLLPAEDMPWSALLFLRSNTGVGWLKTVFRYDFLKERSVQCHNMHMS